MNKIVYTMALNVLLASFLYSSQNSFTVQNTKNKMSQHKAQNNSDSFACAQDEQIKVIAAFKAHNQQTHNAIGINKK